MHHLGITHRYLCRVYKYHDVIRYHPATYRDACTGNILMDATRVVPEGFHPVFPKWTEDIHRLATSVPRCKVGLVHYYFIDFEFTIWFPDREAARVNGR